MVTRMHPQYFHIFCLLDLAFERALSGDLSSEGVQTEICVAHVKTVSQAAKHDRRRVVFPENPITGRYRFASGTILWLSGEFLSRRPEKKISVRKKCLILSQRLIAKPRESRKNPRFFSSIKK